MSSNAWARRPSSGIALAASCAGAMSERSSVERISRRYVSNFSSGAILSLSTSGRSSVMASFLTASSEASPDEAGAAAALAGTLAGAVSSAGAGGIGGGVGGRAACGCAAAASSFTPANTFASSWSSLIGCVVCGFIFIPTSLLSFLLCFLIYCIIDKECIASGKGGFKNAR